MQSRLLPTLPLCLLLCGCDQQTPPPPTAQVETLVNPVRRATPPRNIIVMVADGAGSNTLEATRLFTGAPLVMDAPEWSLSWVCTSKLRQGDKPMPGAEGLAQDPEVLYDSKKAWDATSVEGGAGGYDFHFKGYQWLRATSPDSANTMTAVASGVRTYAGAINVDGNGTPVESMAHVARKAGKRVGILTTVPWNHATPAAGGGAQHISRNAYHDIAAQMLSSGLIDVLGGAGNPDYGPDGQELKTPVYKFIGETEWKKLKQRQPFGANITWTLVENDFASVTTETTLPVLLQIRNGETSQQARAAAKDDGKKAEPREDALLGDVPTLADMTRATLPILDADPDGFYLVVEGGAVDWAMHANQCGRMVEEYMEFDDAVGLVSQYLSTPGHAANWENTLVIVTADHDHLLLGPNSDKVAFEELQSKGEGHLPGYIWHSDGHSNRLVPLFVRGAQAADLLMQADEVDEAQIDGREVGRGAYMQQPEIGAFLKALYGC